MKVHHWRNATVWRSGPRFPRRARYYRSPFGHRPRVFCLHRRVFVGNECECWGCCDCNAGGECSEHAPVSPQEDVAAVVAERRGEGRPW